MKRQQGLSLISLCVLIAALSLLYYSTTSPYIFGKAIEDKNKVRNLVIIDRFIYQWWSANDKKYPNSLSDMEFIGLKIDVVDYKYSVSVAKDKYRLWIDKNNKTYISPGSDM